MEVDKKLAQKHWDEMEKLFKEKVLAEKDESKADEILKQLTDEELAWLKKHPGYPRFFSPINMDVDRPKMNFPDMKKIPCVGCIFAEKKYAGEMNAFCQVYKYPNMKPDNVLWGKNPKCEYRVDEKDVKKSKKK